MKEERCIYLAEAAHFIKWQFSEFVSFQLELVDQFLFVVTFKRMFNLFLFLFLAAFEEMDREGFFMFKNIIAMNALVENLKT